MTSDLWGPLPTARTNSSNPERPTAVYWLYGKQETLLYVGMTNNPIQRFAEHSRDKSWWGYVVEYSIRWFDTRAAAESAEKIAIANDGPEYNVDHQPRHQPFGGIPLLPAYLSQLFFAALCEWVDEWATHITEDDRQRLIVDFVNTKIQGTVFRIPRYSAPPEKHPLDMDALLAAVKCHGPLIAPTATPERPQ